MNYKVLFVLSAVLAVVVGLGFLIIPEKALSLVGTTERYASTLFAARFFGFAMFGLGLVLFFAKDISDAKAQKNLGIANLVICVVGFGLSLYATMAGNAVLRANVWLPVVVFLLGALAYGFLIFLKPKTAQ
ncbi:MAG: hypothetical protein QM730_19905 [Anaerolineales bacterium]